MGLARWTGGGTALFFKPGNLRDQYRAKCGQNRGRAVISIAIIEDNRLVREGIAALLSQLPDLKVVAGGHSDDTVLLKGLNPQVILLDLGLQNGDSLRVAQQVKADYPASKIKIGRASCRERV